MNLSLQEIYKQMERLEDRETMYTAPNLTQQTLFSIRKFAYDKKCFKVYKTEDGGLKIVKLAKDAPKSATALLQSIILEAPYDYPIELDADSQAVRMAVIKLRNEGYDIDIKKNTVCKNEYKSYLGLLEHAIKKHRKATALELLQKINDKAMAEINQIIEFNPISDIGDLLTP